MLLSQSRATVVQVGNRQFDFPAGVAVDSSTHEVYVADTGNHRIQVFALKYPFLDIPYSISS
jgi:DNA-binding beta-propeller fold protein YncE